MIFVTGDCHGDWSRFATENFPQQEGMTREDYVIVCGDFGIWHDFDGTETAELNELEKLPFTLLFVDGNHENFDRLNGGEFETVDFCGSKAHRIRENVFHLMRGYVFTLQGKKFYAFGGARSHDIDDGILDPEDYKSQRELLEAAEDWYCRGKVFRIKGMSWWPQEMPTNEEMWFGINTLVENGDRVDYIITHCCPQMVASMLSNGYEPDDLTAYFNTVASDTQFERWYFGHYHGERRLMGKYTLLYKRIERIL